MEVMVDTVLSGSCQDAIPDNFRLIIRVKKGSKMEKSSGGGGGGYWMMMVHSVHCTVGNKHGRQVEVLYYCSWFSLTK